MSFTSWTTFIVHLAVHCFDNSGLTTYCPKCSKPYYIIGLISMEPNILRDSFLGNIYKLCVQIKCPFDRDVPNM